MFVIVPFGMVKGAYAFVFLSTLLLKSNSFFMEVFQKVFIKKYEEKINLTVAQLVCFL